MGNYKSSKLSLKAELEEGEDYTEALANLQKEVVELSGAEPWILKNLPTYKNNQETLKQLDEVQKSYQEKREQLEELVIKVRKMDEKINLASELLTEFENFNAYESGIEKLQELVEAYDVLKNYHQKLQARESEEVNAGSSDSNIF